VVKRPLASSDSSSNLPNSRLRAHCTNYYSTTSSHTSTGVTYLLEFCSFLSTAVNLTPCQEAYRKATQNPKVGSYIPRCKGDGSFENIQCEGGSGHCWCVDKDGKEIAGTRTTGNLQCPDPGMSTN